MEHPNQTLTALILVIILLPIVICLLWIGNEKEAAALKSWKSKEDQDLSELSITSTGKQIDLSGAKIRTILRKEQQQRIDGQLHGISIERVLRSSNGEYFFWLWRSDSTPYIKHMSHTNAKIKLKAKYIYPEKNN